MKARAEKAERVREECKADAEKFCKGIAPGGGRILSCLKSRQPELQPACAAEFKQAGKRRPRPREPRPHPIQRKKGSFFPAPVLPIERCTELGSEPRNTR